MVVSETYTWLRYHTGSNLAIRFLEIIEKAEKAGSLKVIIPHENVKSKAHAVLRKYLDQDLSYVDAVSFVILETMKIKDILGFDSHFYIIKRNLWPSAASTMARSKVSWGKTTCGSRVCAERYISRATR